MPSSMSAKPRHKKAKVGRPPTGLTKIKPSLTLDKDLVATAKKYAFDEKVSFSSWVESAIRKELQLEEAGK